MCNGIDYRDIGPQPAVNFSPDGRTVLTLDNPGIRFRNHATGREMTRIGLIAAIDNRGSVGFTGDGQSLVCDDFNTGFSKNKLMLLTPRSLKEIDEELAQSRQGALETGSPGRGKTTRLALIHFKTESI